MSEQAKIARLRAKHQRASAAVGVPFCQHEANIRKLVPQVMRERRLSREAAIMHLLHNPDEIISRMAKRLHFVKP